MSHRRILGALAVTCAASVPAAQPSWNYAQGRYAYLDADFVPEPFHGFSVASTFALTDRLHLRCDVGTARFVDDDVAVGVALEGESAGVALGLSLPVSANASLYGRFRVDYTRASASVSASGRTYTVSEDGTGFDAEIGARAVLSDRLEVHVAAVHDNVSGDTVADATLAVRLADPVALTVGVAGSGDLRSFGLGLRVYW